MREHSPIAHCVRCGSVTRMLVYEQGIADNGDDFSAVWSDDVPHSQKQCEEFIKLSRETWPTLW